MEQPKPTQDSEEMRSRYIPITSDIRAKATCLENLVYLGYTENVEDYKQKLSEYNQQLTNLLKDGTA